MIEFQFCFMDQCLPIWVVLLVGYISGLVIWPMTMFRSETDKYEFDWRGWLPWQIVLSFIFWPLIAVFMLGWELINGVIKGAYILFRMVYGFIDWLIKNEPVH